MAVREASGGRRRLTVLESRREVLVMAAAAREVDGRSKRLAVAVREGGDGGR